MRGGRVSRNAGLKQGPCETSHGPAGYIRRDARISPRWFRRRRPFRLRRPHPPGHAGLVRALGLSASAVPCSLPGTRTGVHSLSSVAPMCSSVVAGGIGGIIVVGVHVANSLADHRSLGGPVYSAWPRARPIPPGSAAGGLIVGVEIVEGVEFDGVVGGGRLIGRVVMGATLLAAGDTDAAPMAAISTGCSTGASGATAGSVSGRFMAFVPSSLPRPMGLSLYYSMDGPRGQRALRRAIIPARRRGFAARLFNIVYLNDAKLIPAHSLL